MTILNETPVDYPDPPYDPVQEERERNELEEARRLYLGRKKLKLKGDPFKHRKRPMIGPMNLDRLYDSVPLEYGFSLSQ